jgi:hypothetical protein
MMRKSGHRFLPSVACGSLKSCEKILLEQDAILSRRICSSVAWCIAPTPFFASAKRKNRTRPILPAHFAQRTRGLSGEKPQRIQHKIALDFAASRLSQRPV